ncbi:methyl-accepting chemotaxis protein [Candidatus Venteria ishoeyi]|uniref:Methyl-accepting chemotaxis protein CtpL n=1 Tax=Candidatus Venteria ishoeyi TaxID=1899563 RepID=A0A1H6F966_9GAMM|nr:methyl-accepting chemotaxis protein [Candidatus Venteria ishoeyi]MDM8547615.1 methyl-accepting chemotaxis protein [Candidatus Venteria ishoeyi]SEH06143.1 Methyl-accepting chemotaxis protein CtpL [Candidatus Venteria ishoeyi]
MNKFINPDSNRVLFSLIGLLLVAFILMAITFYIVADSRSADQKYQARITSMRLLAQQMTQDAQMAADGNKEAFAVLRKKQEDFQYNLTMLREGNPEEDLLPTPEMILPTLEALETNWASIDTSIEELFKAETVVLAAYGQFEEMTGLTQEITASAEQMIETLVNTGAGQTQMFMATRELMLLERIGNNIRSAYQGNIDAEVQLGEDMSGFVDILNTLLNGNEENGLPAISSPEAQTSIEDLIQLFQERFQIVDEFLDSDGADFLFSAIDAAGDVLVNTDELLFSIEDLQNAYIGTIEERFFSVSLGNIMAGVVFFTMALLTWVMVQSARNRAVEARKTLEESEETNKRNQEAILRLLSEISDLADGDLTVTATVSEDFTGAIADALNFSIESLRDLVVSINQTAEQVSDAAQGTRKIGEQLTEASERQAQQIAKAGQAIIGMTNSVKKVSANAIDSADVAKKSVEIAGKGAKSVQDTISGMDNIREQIQETSKRIKRLGESSQEIGEIVGLIDDIADQTNILALNAAIQAAMAGDAGRGFAVVADEIQRLAERSGNATKQIDALVKTIQGDTNEAVSSMEQSTSNVVDGAKLAEVAGESLIEIESVSVQLAGQIENIAQTSRTQSAVASNIAGTMTIIQEITTQTSQGTNETALSIERLSSLANDLKTSVSGFTLPSSGGAADELMPEEDDGFVVDL